MATQPQKDNILKLLEDRIVDNLDIISESEVGVQENQVIIDYFDPSCNGLDTQILSLTNNINNLKSEIVSIYSEAYAVGCGTTGGSTIIYPDTAIDSSYNLSIPTYDEDDPYIINNQTLDISNVGFGTFIIYKQDDTDSLGLGSAYGDIESCYELICNSGDCINFADQITQRQNQIVTLRNEIISLIPAVNSIKTERLDYQVRRWSDRFTIRDLTLENQRIGIAISILNDPQYDSFI
jgi:hypothetical protein